ncbi:MAG: HEAT repeat domain-containing protein [Methanobacteriaceae archaeon]|nr:HEAT repeat domain-containing protein [Methanobacteriaceae archaeon]
MAIFKDKFQELEENNDINGLIELLNADKWQHRYKAIVSLINIGDSSAIEQVKGAMDDDNSIVRETAIKYLRMNNAYPKTRPEDIKLYPFDIKNSYTRIKKITASSDDSIHSESAANEDINNKLKEEAANLGANAIIELVYEKGIFTLFRGVKGHGNAVFIKDLKSVERKQDSGLGLFALGIFFIMQGLVSFPYFPKFLVPIGIFVIINGIFTRLGYKNKTYFLTFLSLIIGFGAIGIFYILKNGFQFYTYDYYLVFMFLLIIAFVYEYLKRKSNTNLPWKDQWGFS